MNVLEDGAVAAPTPPAARRRSDRRPFTLTPMITLSAAAASVRAASSRKTQSRAPGKTSWNRTSHRAQGQFAAFGQGVAQEGAYMRDAAWTVSGHLPS